MKEDKTMVVSVNRLRKFNSDDVEKNEEDNTIQYELMRMELNAITKTIQELLERQTMIKNQCTPGEINVSEINDNDNRIDTSIENEEENVGVWCLVVPDEIITLF